MVGRKCWGGGEGGVFGGWFRRGVGFLGLVWMLMLMLMDFVLSSVGSVFHTYYIPSISSPFVTCKLSGVGG